MHKDMYNNIDNYGKQQEQARQVVKYQLIIIYKDISSCSRRVKSRGINY